MPGHSDSHKVGFTGRLHTKKRSIRYKVINYVPIVLEVVRHLGLDLE